MMCLAVYTLWSSRIVDPGLITSLQRANLIAHRLVHAMINSAIDLLNRLCNCHGNRLYRRKDFCPIISWTLNNFSLVNLAVVVTRRLLTSALRTLNS